MDISSAPLGILKWVKDWVEKKLFLNLYEKSHIEHLKHRNKTYYRNLVKDIEYDLRLENEFFSNKNNPTSSLLIKFPESSKNLTLQGKVVASSGLIQYQENFNISYEGKPHVKLNLPQIPLLKCFTTNNGIGVSISEIYIKGKLIKDDGSETEFETLKSHPMYNEFLNSDWIFKWGIAWNMDHLYQNKSNFRQRILYRLLGDLWMFSTYRPTSGLQGKVSTIYAKTIVNTIGHDKVCNVVFWIFLRLGIKKLRPS